MENLRKLCGCALPQYPHFADAIPQCLLDDMPCLFKWKSAWNNFEPLTNVKKTAEMHLDVHCPECLATCNVIKYFVESSTAEFDPNINYEDSDLL